MQPGAMLYTQGFGSRPENVEVPHIDSRAPATTDNKYPIGKRWIDQVGGNEYSLTSYSSTNGVLSANWAFLGSSSGDLNSLTADGPTIVTPTSGTILFKGTANQVTTAGSNAPGTVTVSLPSVLIAPGSLEVTSGFTVDAGTTALTGTVNINTTGAGVTQVGSLTSGATTLDSGGTLTVDVAAAQNATFIPSQTSGTLNIGGTGNNTGTATILGGTGIQTINFANSTGVKTINFATGAAANVLTIGSTSGAASTTINGGSAGVTITGTNGAVTINSGTGTLGISADAAATTVNIATGGAAKTTTLGSTNTTSVTHIQSGSGGISLATGTTAGNVTITPVLASAAASTVVCNGRVGQATFTGQTTGSTVTAVYTVTNSAITGTTQAILVSADNLGSNDAQMTITRVLQSTGSMAVSLKNNGAATLNGDVHITFWILN